MEVETLTRAPEHDGAKSRARPRRPACTCTRPHDFGLRAQQHWITRWQRQYRTAYLGRRKPTPRQAELIAVIADLDWALAVARHVNTPQSWREVREHYRVRQAHLDELERSAVSAAVRPAR